MTMTDWKAAMADLVRRGGGGYPPLFAPLVRGVASQIDAISPLEMVSDPTRLGKGITELARAGGIDVLVTAAPCGMEAQALGAQINFGQWPPQVVGPKEGDLNLNVDFDDAFSEGELIASAIECTTRLAKSGVEGKLIVAALTGPSTLSRQLTGNDAPDDVAREFASEALAALARKFGQNGADLIIMIEQNPMIEGWAELYGTIGNNAKFLKKPLVPIVPGDAIGWPRLAIDRSAISIISSNPTEWQGSTPADGTRVIVTNGEVRADTPLELLLPLLEDTRYDMGA